MTNIMKINRPRIFGNLDFGFNYGINKKIHKQYNSKILDGSRDTLDHPEMISLIRMDVLIQGR